MSIIYLKKNKKFSSSFFISKLKKYQYQNLFYFFFKKFNFFPINIEKDLSTFNFIMYKYSNDLEENQNILFDYSMMNSFISF